MSECQIIQGDCIESMAGLDPESVHCCITSPPYWGLRDYRVDGQIGLEETPDEYVSKMVDVFRAVRRVLRDNGTLWLNLGDSYAGTGTNGLKTKDLVGIPWRVAFALQADGWYLRQDIIWHKPNPMPESVKDRCTKAHEYVFLLSKSAKYYYDHEAIKETAVGGRPGNKTHKGKTAYEQGDEKMRTKAGLTKIGAVTKRNKRSVWTVSPRPFVDAHFAVFPPALIEPCILAGCPEGGTVLDPFGGSGTTAEVAIKHKRNAILCELNPEYVGMAEGRVEGVVEASGFLEGEYT